MIQISTHFFAHEFLVSHSHPDLALAMTLSDEELQKLHYLCLFALEPIRAQFGTEVVIHSGKRSPELNLAVGGKINSQHMLCEACDFHVARVRQMEVYQYLDRTMLWPGQCFLYLTDDFCHVALPRIGIAPNHGVL